MRMLFEEGVHATIREFNDISLVPCWESEIDYKKEPPTEIFLNINYEGIAVYHVNNKKKVYEQVIAQFDHVVEQLLEKGYCRDKDFEHECLEWLDVVWSLNPEIENHVSEAIKEITSNEHNIQCVDGKYTTGKYKLHINEIGVHELAQMLANLPHNTEIKIPQIEDAGIVYVPGEDIAIIDDSNFLKELFALYENDEEEM